MIPPSRAQRIEPMAAELAAMKGKKNDDTETDK